MLFVDCVSPIVSVIKVTVFPIVSVIKLTVFPIVSVIKVTVFPVVSVLKVTVCVHCFSDKGDCVCVPLFQ